MPESGARELPPPGRRPAPEALAQPADRLAEPARLSRLQLLRETGSSPRGLTEAEAEARLAEHGENTVLPRPEPPAARRALATLRDPFAALLACLALVCAVIGSWGSVVILAVLVVASCLLRFLGERRSALALRALRELVPSTATVLRRAVSQDLPVARELPTDQLVPGDVVRLAVGDAVPADLRLLRADGLTVDQSALTGESEPARRQAPDEPPTSPAEDLFDEPHLCFTGSRVATGSATGLVLATGPDTRFGAAHLLVAPVEAGQSQVERGVRRAVRALILFMLAAVPLTVGADTLLHGWSAALVPFAVAAAVGLTPELLPLVLSTVLARGSRQLTGDQVGPVRALLPGAARRTAASGPGLVVRRLPAVSELGALDVLCVDKTGTLTTGEVTVTDSLDPQGKPDPQPLRWAATAVDAALSLDPGLYDPADEALLAAADLAGLLDGPTPTVLDLIPFDPDRRRAGVVLREPGRHVLLVKGAPEAVLARCTEIETPDGPRPLDERARAGVEQVVAERTGAGLRLLAVARAERAPGSAATDRATSGT